MRRSLVAILITGVLVAGGIADAHHMTIRDDSGERGVLDVRAVNVHGIESPRWKISTWARWTKDDIWDQGYFLVYLDTFGDEHYDYYAIVRSDGRRMRASLVRHRKEKPDLTVSSLSSWKPDRRSAAVRVPMGKVKKARNRATYAWYVETVYSGNGCSRVCFDWAPDAASGGEGVHEPFPVD